jgi:hypothetical protein
MRVTRVQARWAVGTGFVSTGLAVAVNLATGSQDNFLAWLAVVVLGPLSGLVSLWAQSGFSGATPSDHAAAPRKIEDNRRHKNDRSVTVRTVNGTVRISQNAASVWVFVVQLVILALLGFMLVFLTRGNAAESSTSQSNGVSEVSAKESPSAPVNRPKSQDVDLVAETSWPLTRGCDGGTTVAMAHGGPPVQSFQIDGDERQRMVDAGGASWQSGTLYVDLSAKADKAVKILNIRPNIQRKQLPPPDWVYSPWGGCGGPSDRVFDLKLDDASLVDRGIVEGTAELSSGARADAIGPAFVVSAEMPATLRFDTDSCRGNYEWSLEITYSVVGQEGSLTRLVGPFRSMGYADATVSYTISGAGDSYSEVGVLDGYIENCT